MPRPNMQVSHHSAGGKVCDFVSCAFRFCWCVGSFQGLCGTVGTMALSKSRRRLPSVDVQQLLSQVHGPAFVFSWPHIGARNSRNRFRKSSTGAETVQVFS